MSNRFPQFAGSHIPTAAGEFRGDGTTAAWLTEPAAEVWFARVAEAQNAGESLLRLTERLRRELPSERVTALVEQVELRRRGTDKFPAAARMFFTPKGLEQATEGAIAAYKGVRVAAAAANMTIGKPVRFLDLGCGIGGDLLGLELAGQVNGYESDPVTAHFAAVNLARCGTRAAQFNPNNPQTRHASESASQVLNKEFSVANLEKYSPEPPDFWHCDPDRRATGARTIQWEAQAPGLDLLAAIWRTWPHGAIKGAPAAPLPPALPSDATREWISSRRECRQQVLWLGSAAFAHGVRVATRVAEDERVEIHPSGGRESPGAFAAIANVAERDNLSSRYPLLTVTSYSGLGCRGVAWSYVGQPHETARQLAEWQHYLYEPDPAVLAAELAGSLANSLSLGQVAADIPYFTADVKLAHPLLRGFEIRAVMPWRAAKVKAWLSERGIGELEIKKRGINLRPEEVRQQLAVKGENRGVLLLTRQAERITAILAERVAGRADCDPP